MRKSAVASIGLVLILAASGAVGQKVAPGQTAPPAAAPPASGSIVTNLDFGRVPLYFIPNQGQLDKQVAYYVQGKDKSIYFTPGGVTLSIAQPEKTATKSSAVGKWVVKLDFVGADAKVKPTGEEKTGGVISYFKGQPKDWQAGLPAYSRIVYRDLWPGIDLAYSGTSNRLKYEFIVHPGADPKQIRLAYRGTDGISVDEEGRLEVQTAAGGFKDDSPVAWQKVAGARREVTLSYKLDGSKGYGFEVGAYDSSQLLVLDPS